MGRATRVTSRHAVRRDIGQARHPFTHLVFGPSGALYVTDPPFGLVGQDKDRRRNTAGF